MSETSQPEPITYHWIMTAQMNGGSVCTRDGRTHAIPGAHTQESTFSAVRKAMGEVLGTDEFAVIFYSLTPNQL